MIKRKPDLIIGEDVNAPYLLRWFLIPRNRFFNIYLHKFCRSDDDRALHDHPWIFNCSILVKGEYIEHILQKDGSVIQKHRKRGIYFRWGKAAHRVELIRKHVKREYLNDGVFEVVEAPCWTIFVTGWRVREWGFYCPKGWKHWKAFTDTRDGRSKRGAGCE